MRRRKPAFTLLELLTVIAILGLLISILIPSLSAARRSAKANVCLSHLKGIGNAFAVYLNENDDRFPPHRLVRVRPTSGEYFVNRFGRRAPRWQWFIETDVGPVINTAPFQGQISRLGFFDDVAWARTGGAGNGMTMSTDVFTCPALDDEEFSHSIRDGAYGYNYQYLGNTRQSTMGGRWANFAVGLHQLRNLSSTVVVADSRGAGPKHGKHSYTLDPPRLATERNADQFGPFVRVDDYLPPDDGYLPEGGNSDDLAYSPMEPRHNGRGNVLFADTHAQAMTLRDLGYQLVHDHENANLPKGAPHPIADPSTGTYTASNKLWNGQGFDRIAEEHRPQDDGG